MPLPLIILIGITTAATTIVVGLWLVLKYLAPVLERITEPKTYAARFTPADVKPVRTATFEKPPSVYEALNALNPKAD